MPKTFHPGIVRRNNIKGDEAVQIGFAISAGNSDYMAGNVYDDIHAADKTNHRYEILSKYIGTLVTEEGEITPEGWDQLADDAIQVESNVLAWLRGTFENARAEGHSDDDIVGTLWVDPSNPDQMDEIRAGEPYDDGGRRIVHFDYEPAFEKGVSDFGLAAGIDNIMVEYFDLLKLGL